MRSDGSRTDEGARRRAAAVVADTIHVFMRAIGPEIQRRSGDGLHMQQFRAMTMLREMREASLSDLAAQTGSTISAASKVIDGLVERGYVVRETAPGDRRKLVLSLSAAGQEKIAGVDNAAADCLEEHFATLTDNECAMLALAMEVLRKALPPRGPAGRTGPGGCCGHDPDPG
jgi:DNA-binding MarR family transcriptional regulator